MPFPGRLVARGRIREPGVMNKTEAAYSMQLEARKRSGEILWWCYEGIKLRLAPKTFLTPDFAVMLASGEIELHEVKGGHWEDDARVKIKVAADLFPFRFIEATYRNKATGWEIKETLPDK